MDEMNVALKEWHLLCEALLSGEQTILLRKGGIYDSAGEFELEHDRFFLFPTFLHQQETHVKPMWRSRLEQSLRTPRLPDEIAIRGWAGVREIMIVPNRAKMDALDDLHMWDTPLIDMRFNYRPGYPLYLVVVQAFLLPQPAIIKNAVEYAGCKSWVPLDGPISTVGSSPVLDSQKLESIVQRIEQCFHS